MRSFDDLRTDAGCPPVDGGSAGITPSLPPAPSDPPHLSPSLRTDRNGVSAFEVKFLLPDDLAREVERMLGAGLALDPHTDPALGNAYRTTTLYCDTPAFDVYHGTGPGKNRKHRVRRYGSSDVAFVERKKKKGPEVEKRRSSVPLAELAALADAHVPESDWPGEWFRKRVGKHALRPVCRVTYDRTAYTGNTPDGPLRLTFDRRLRGALAAGWDLSPVRGEDLLGGLVIVEFKFQGALPAVGKRVVEDLRLEPGGASKYRRFLADTGVVPPRVKAPKPAG